MNKEEITRGLLECKDADDIVDFLVNLPVIIDSHSEADLEKPFYYPFIGQPVYHSRLHPVKFRLNKKRIRGNISRTKHMA